jgi:hypothetical protein
VITTEDRAIEPARQREMADAIPGATVHEHADGHIACMRPAFAPCLLAACQDVASRIAAPAA